MATPSPAAAITIPGLTTTSLSAAPTSATVGEGVTLTATVSEMSGTPTGTVTFVAESGGSAFTGCTDVALQLVDSMYQATCDAVFTSAGTHTLVADFNGTGGSYSSESLPLDYQVAGAPTTVTLSSSSPTPVVGLDFSIVAVVNASTPPVAGTMRFEEGGLPIGGCTAVLVGELVGVGGALSPPEAQCQVTYSAPGTHTIVAVYSGDAFGHAGATSAPLTITVDVGGGGKLAPCPGQDVPFLRSSPAAARAAVICVLDEALAGYGLPSVADAPATDAFLQGHPGRFTRAGGAQYGEELNGVPTPYDLASALLAGQSCIQVLLGASELGLGIDSEPVLASPPPPQVIEFAEGPGLTFELLQPGPPRQQNIAAAHTCPHQLPLRSVGLPPSPGLRLDSAAALGGLLQINISGSLHQPTTARLQIVAGVGRQRITRTVTVRRLAYRAHRTLHIRVGRRALAGRALVTVHVQQTKPAAVSYLYETVL
jgi:hypothetical protein